MRLMLTAIVSLVLTSCGAVAPFEKGEERLSTLSSSQFKIKDVEEKFRNAGIASQVWTTPRGAVGLLILPTGLHAWNRMAAELKDSHFDLKLVYMPSELSRGMSVASALFDPTHNIIGISNKMVETLAIDESFEHEMVHANEFAERARGRMNGLHMTSQLVKGSRMSERSHDVYVRFMSFEEMAAFARSISVIAANVTDARLLNPSDLSRLYYSFDAGKEISDVVQDVVVSARRTLHSLKFSRSVKAGLPFVDVTIETDSIERLYVAGRGENKVVPGGTLVTLTLSDSAFSGLTTESARQIAKDALDDAQRFANALNPYYQQGVDAFGFVLEHPRPKDVDFDKLNAAIAKIKEFDAMRSRR